MRCPKPATLLNIAAVLLFLAVLGIAVTRAPIVEAAGASQAPAPKPQAAQPPPKPATPQTTVVATSQAPGTPPAGYVGSEVCATCHTGYDTSINASKHGQAHDARTPAAKLGCESCHGPGEAHASDPEKVKPIQFTKISAKAVSETCTTCHNRGVHALWKGSQHEARNVSCISCHSIHKPMSTTSQLKAMNQQNTCITCHRDKVAKLDKSGHMPVREGKMECSSCHNPHGTTNVRLLKTGNTINESCTSCHAEKRGPWLFEHAGINRRQLHDLPRSARVEQRPHAGGEAAIPLPAVPQPHAASVHHLRQQGCAEQQSPVRAQLRHVPFGDPRVEPPVRIDVPEAVGGDHAQHILL